MGSAVRSTSNGPRTEGSRAPGPWPVASPHRRPAPPPTNGIPTWTLAHTGRCGGQPAAAPGSPKRPGAWPRLRLGTAPTGGGRPGTGQPHVCPCSPGPGPFPAERDRANAPHCCSSLPSIGPDPGVDTSRSLSSAPSQPASRAWGIEGEKNHTHTHTHTHTLRTRSKTHLHSQTRAHATSRERTHARTRSHTHRPPETTVDHSWRSPFSKPQEVARTTHSKRPSR